MWAANLDSSWAWLKRFLHEFAIVGPIFFVTSMQSFCLQTLGHSTSSRLKVLDWSNKWCGGGSQADVLSGWKHLKTALSVGVLANTVAYQWVGMGHLISWLASPFWQFSLSRLWKHVWNMCLAACPPELEWSRWGGQKAGKLCALRSQTFAMPPCLHDPGCPDVQQWGRGWC